MLRNKNHLWKTLPILAALLLLGSGSCGDSGDRGDEGSGDTDADGDNDVDEGDCGECPLNSGYPCPCTEDCQDGSWCMFLEPTDSLGYCARGCETDPDCATDKNCLSEKSCSLVTPDESRFCRLHCEEHTDCPEDMLCVFAEQGDSTSGTCYPNAESLCCYDDNPCELEANELCDCDSDYEKDWDFKDCAPETITIRFLNAAVAPAKADGSVWDGIGSVPDDVWDAFLILGPEAALFTDLADFLAESALDALDAPDPYGIAQLDVGDGYGAGMYLATPENNQQEAYVPEWPGDPVFEDVPFTEDLTIRVQLWDEDELDADDSIGLAILDYEVIKTAYMNGGAHYENVAAQTYNQLLILGIEVF